MRGSSRFAAWAAVGCLGVLCSSGPAGAQVVRPVASVAAGSIEGVVRDEHGGPLAGVIVSALGTTTASATTDSAGRFELTLSPGPYLVRAHLAGFAASRGQIIDVVPNSRASSSIALRRAPAAASVASPPVLAAGVASAPAGESTAPEAAAPDTATAAGGDDHGETAWRLRHARRSVLKEAMLPDDLVAEEDPDATAFGASGVFARSVYARGLANFFTDTAFSGQVNLLTTGSFDSPVQLFTSDNFARGIAFLSLSAPAGGAADWTVRGALTQGDVSSWILAGSYVTRDATARHKYDIGMSYATQRYEGGNTATLRDVTDGSRNAGEVYGFDTFALTPAVSLTYGSRFAHYDYLAGRALMSPRIAVTLQPIERTRVSTLVSSRAVVPGAEEFLPPGDTGIWLPPQRTFSSLEGGQPLRAERATHLELGVERDVAASSTVSFRAFRQHVDNQLVTVFGVQMPGRPQAALGHYFVANAGDVDATGWAAGARTALAQRVHGSFEYSLARTQWNPGAANLTYLVFVAPSTVRMQSERIHDVSATVETEVPETSTRVLVLYRVSSAFAHAPVPPAQTTGPNFDSRFDVQVRQSLPFMNFSGARWEMLLAVHNFFREAASDQSIYDELLVVHPPKRLVGGLTMRF